MTTRAVAEQDLVIDLRDPPSPRSETPRRHRTDVFLLVALNVLNVSDAVLTYFVTGSGIAVEGNPVVEWLTLPGKVVLVAALSLGALEATAQGTGHTRRRLRRGRRLHDCGRALVRLSYPVTVITPRIP